MQKKVIFVAFLGVAMSVSAQFTTGSSNVSSVANTNDYNRITLSYENTHFGANDKMKHFFNGEDGMSLNGVGFEYIHGFSISKAYPMFIESGVKLQFGAGSVTDEDYDEEVTLKLQRFSFSIPVNYTYRFAIGENMNIAPFIGLNFKLHAMGRQKYDFSYDYDDWYDYDDYDDDEDSKWISLFDKKKMGKNETWNRFQMGWQVGIGFNVKTLYIGVQYGTDFIQAYKHKKYGINSGDFAAKVGFCF